MKRPVRESSALEDHSTIEMSKLEHPEEELQEQLSEDGIFVSR
jgi:hypothetical protein